MSHACNTRDILWIQPIAHSDVVSIGVSIDTIVDGDNEYIVVILVVNAEAYFEDLINLMIIDLKFKFIMYCGTATIEFTCNGTYVCERK